jgi:hypothetical protein
MATLVLAAKVAADSEPSSFLNLNLFKFRAGGVATLVVIISGMAVYVSSGDPSDFTILKQYDVPAVAPLSYKENSHLPSAPFGMDCILLKLFSSSYD